MDAVKYLNALDRMCKSYKQCQGCGLQEDNGLCSVSCDPIPAEKIVSYVKTWAAEHPAKTYKQDFLEKFPKAPVSGIGVPSACRDAIYKSGSCGNIGSCTDCWNEEM